MASGRQVAEENVQAFTAYVINGVPAQQVADSLGLSIEQVYQAKSRILKRMSATIERQRREED